MAPVPASGGQKPAAPARVVAIGDVHGDYDAFAAILQKAGLLNEKLAWAGGNTTLVQTGDFLDRGPKDRQVIELLMRLEKEAPKKGGRALILLGNHEVMNLMGDMRYVSKETLASYAGQNSEKKRQEAWRDYVEYQKASAKGLGQEFVATPEAEKAWMDAHPAGFIEHRQAMAPEGKYGKWLRAHGAMARVGETIYVHGGISPVLASIAPTVEAINKRIAEELGSFDYARQYLVERKLALPFFTLEELTRAAQTELDARNAEVGKKSAEAAAAGKTYKTDAETQQHISLVSGFLGFPAWFCVHQEGPLWFRGYAAWNDAEGAAQVTSVLTTYGAQRIVVGHTVQRDGNIKVRFDGKVVLIDTGMLFSRNQGGRASALEMTGGKLTAIYPEERVALTNGAATAATGSTTVPEEESDESLGGVLTGQGPSAAANPAPAAKHDRHFLDANGQPLPFHSDAELLEYLKTAKAVKIKDTKVGIAGTRKVLLEKDGVQMNAAFRTVNEEKTEAKLASGRTELFFRDNYLFENAAYELSEILGLEVVPPVVRRKVNGQDGSLQVWVEGAMMELDRQKKKIKPPNIVRWNNQLLRMRLFDNLIYNIDRNMGNILIDGNWNVWLIDHTRAFRRYDSLQNPGQLIACERTLWERLKSANPNEIQARLKPYLRKAEIEGILSRRLKLIELFEKLIQERGESQVLYTLEH